MRYVALCLEMGDVTSGVRERLAHRLRKVSDSKEWDIFQRKGLLKTDENPN